MSNKSNSSSRQANQLSSEGASYARNQVVTSHGIKAGSGGSSQGANINAFLLSVARPSAGFLPMNPWTVSGGTYTRPDGTTIDLHGPQQFQGITVNVSAHASTKEVLGIEDRG
ncbi:hypothetical protein EJ02DRAFT_514124 [Clathrospora elynae]|uniref:Uncharacterized protein n=1 Tax=Clathrospora elynae TaxID=706981 RepID=A0A6A5SI73_9PLEO|nr:hypothetical protein EJ02DRAFT_514124 [Clathrospora elynae]